MPLYKKTLWHIRPIIPRNPDEPRKPQIWWKNPRHSNTARRPATATAAARSCYETQREDEDAYCKHSGAPWRLRPAARD